VSRALGPAGRLALAAAARPDALLAFDFDGTLAPIVARPDAARMRPRTRRLLAALAEVRPCAVLSGRARADLLGRVAGVPLRFAVGNHGAEWGEPREAAARGRLARAAAALRERLAGARGVWVEDKGLSLAVHYRAAPDRAAAARAIARAVREVAGVRAFGGKAVLNVLPAGAPDKGTALLRMMRRARTASAIYVGDDTTDEDAFRAAAGRGLGIRVGRRRGSAARLTLEDQRAVDALLEALLGAAKDGRRPPAQLQRSMTTRVSV
jgi:trehalose 6-phosphate phosphatase